MLSEVYVLRWEIWSVILHSKITTTGHEGKSLLKLKIWQKSFTVNTTEISKTKKEADCQGNLHANAS